MNSLDLRAAKLMGFIVQTKHGQTFMGEEDFRPSFDRNDLAFLLNQITERDIEAESTFIDRLWKRIPHRSGSIEFMLLLAEPFIACEVACDILEELSED